jgi:hypothetical protein
VLKTTSFGDTDTIASFLRKITKSLKDVRGKSRNYNGSKSMFSKISFFATNKKRLKQMVLKQLCGKILPSKGGLPLSFFAVRDKTTYQKSLALWNSSNSSKMMINLEGFKNYKGPS